MKNFIIKSNYEYEIKAKDKDEAIEVWNESIEDELGAENTTLERKFAESLYAEEEK